MYLIGFMNWSLGYGRYRQFLRWAAIFVSISVTLALCKNAPLMCSRRGEFDLIVKSIYSWCKSKKSKSMMFQFLWIFCCM